MADLADVVRHLDPHNSATHFTAAREACEAVLHKFDTKTICRYWQNDMKKGLPTMIVLIGIALILLLLLVPEPAAHPAQAPG